MTGLFLKIVNMSIAASWLVPVVLILRLVLKRAPRWVPVLLWGLVAVRLVCPFSVESALSLLPSAETLRPGIMMEAAPSVQTGIPAVNGALRQLLAPSPGDSANPLQIWIPVMAAVWITGAAALLVYTAVSYRRLYKRIDTAVLLRDNIFQSENVNSPFVLGILRPRIYLPFRMDGQNLAYVIAHEQAHIGRRDHWWKPLGFLLLTIHWFNPLLWLAYGLLCRDMELACDEKVIQALDCEQRAGYSQALLDCSVSRRRMAACPLAFGEVGVRERVKSVMNYKKPAFWIVLTAVIACMAVAICFLTDPKPDCFDIKFVVPAGSQEGYVYSEEEISPTGKRIILTAGDHLGDTEVVLKPVEASRENAYDEAFYLTPGMPVKIAAEKGAWFQIGIRMQNPTSEDRVVYVNVDHIEVRIAGNDAADPALSRTEYIGDAPAVSAIAQQLPYPEGYSCSTIELQTGREPYELTVYLNGSGRRQEEDWKPCADLAFRLIGNMGILSFRQADSEALIASFTREDCETGRQYYLTIGAEDVTEVVISMPGTSSGCQTADGSPYHKGDILWLESLDGYSDLRGLEITALNEKGEAVWSASVPDGEENRALTHLSQDGWTIQCG